MEKSSWIWYPGDMELYHGMKQNFSRVERGYGWPAFWKSEGFRNRVVFRRTYELENETSFCVYSKAVGYVLAGEKKYPFGSEIMCERGKLDVSIHAACIETFPSIYIEGDVICSDEEWMVEDYSAPLVPVGYSKYFTKKEQDPSCWEYTEKLYEPIRCEEKNGGVLFEFETELTAVLQVEGNVHPYPRVYCGESEEEALDLIHCYYSWEPDAQSGKCPCCAVRYAFLPECKTEDVKLHAYHQYVDFPVRAEFKSNDPLLNQIWSVSEHTFRLCSGIFFIDGVKRDKWIWSGDAYQSLFVNPYLLADKEIEQRTLLALRGNDPMTTHINTIVDYSFFWILGVWKHFQVYKDSKFLQQVYPKMCSLMEFCEKQTDEHGFIVGREKDWIYIDWAELDKEGPLGAEQILFAACWKVMAELGKVLDKEYTEYEEKHIQLCTQIEKMYWDKEKGAYIDSYCSGKRFVTRQTNIFAVLFGIADQDKTEQIMKNVILNDSVPQITTPYFKFYEMDILCRAGKLDTVLQRMRQYWGGMLERGAVTFWEEFDPEVPEQEQYDMYGDRFGKSLCHAWSASPIYLLAKYFVGLQLEETGDRCFVLQPQLGYLKEMDCTLPIGEGKVHIKWNQESVVVETDRTGGVLKIYGEERKLEAGKTEYFQLRP